MYLLPWQWRGAEERPWQARTNSRYSAGGESAHKSWALENHSSLRDYMYKIQNISKEENVLRRRTCSSAGPERSQQLQIPPSLNSKAILQWVRLLFLLRQHFCRCLYFSRRRVFSIRLIFWMCQIFSIPLIFWIELNWIEHFGCTKFLASAKDFEGANVFGCTNVLNILWHLYFVYFSAFLFSIRQ